MTDAQKAVELIQVSILLGLTACIGLLRSQWQLRREIRRLRCELSGHSEPMFKRFATDGYCLQCKNVIAIRAPESSGQGLQRAGDTLHQRIARLEAALRIEDVR